MNTFLPFRDFNQSSSILDDKRLNKQILEAWQIINGQWPNHPCSKMWKNNIDSLKHYYNSCLYRWKFIKGKNHKFKIFSVPTKEWVGSPNWFSNKLVFFTHKVNLLRKDFNHYSKYIPNPKIHEQSDHFPNGYYWPVGPLGKVAQQHVNDWTQWGIKNLWYLEEIE